MCKFRFFRWLGRLNSLVQAVECIFEFTLAWQLVMARITNGKRHTLKPLSPATLPLVPLNEEPATREGAVVVDMVLGLGQAWALRGPSTFGVSRSCDSLILCLSRRVVAPHPFHCSVFHLFNGTISSDT